MQIRLCLLFSVVLVISSRLGAQSMVDSLITLRKTGQLDGRVTTYYSPRYRERAEKIKSAYEGAIRFYEASYPVHFSLKMAVLDSASWLTEEMPYGYLVYDSGWAMIPAYMSYDFFLRLNGITDQKTALDSLMKSMQVSPEEMINSVLLIYSLHELGHYFVLDLEHASIPDNLADELIATYFSLNYFKSVPTKDLSNMLAFCSFIKEHYHAAYRKISDMDILFSKMPVQNFKWFHCNIALLCNEIYRREQDGFIRSYLQMFPAGNQRNYSTGEVIDLLDEKTGGQVSPWSKELEVFRR
jgi:hypothetical protein